MAEKLTLRGIVTFMEKLALLPIAARLESGTYLLYDGSSGNR